jgi:hypothetical protein
MPVGDFEELIRRDVDAKELNPPVPQEAAT